MQYNILRRVWRKGETMSQTDSSLSPKHKVDHQVYILPPGLRSFELPGDADLYDPMHGPLMIRGISPVLGGGFGAFMYALAVDPMSNVTIFVPECGIDG